MSDQAITKDGHVIWCLDESRDATASCAMAQHKMAIKENVAEEVEDAPPPPIPPPFVAILRELADERRRQRDDHGWTVAHDDNLTAANWAWLEMQRVTTVMAPTIRPADARRCWIELAAIATAAVEALDRAEARQGF